MSIGVATSTVLLRGRISNYQKTRKTQDFLITEGDREQAGLTALAAALAGSGGAVGLAGMTDTKEEADFVEFDLDGKAIEGWITWSPFDENDEVEIVAEKLSKGSYRAFGVRRIDDHIVALHPHCSRGRIAHYRITVKWGINIFFPVYFLCCVIASIFVLNESDVDWSGFGTTVGGGALVAIAVFVPIVLSISRRFMPFVRMAEAIFMGFGWKDVKNIDLPAISKKNKKPGDGPGMGRLYFRY